MTRTALLAVDVQNGFVSEASRHIPAIVEALSASPEYALVCVSRFVDAPDSAFVRWRDYNRFRAADGRETQLAFRPPAGAFVFDKSCYSAAIPALLQRLEEADIAAVHLAGLDTNMCVLATAIALFDDGRFRPSVLADACASHSGPQFHQAGLMLLEKALGAAHILRAHG